jgi:hypothetical protein
MWLLLAMLSSCKTQRDLRPEDSSDTQQAVDSGDTETEDAPDRSMRFNGVGRLEVAIDDPATTNESPVADIGDRDFTIEFWLKGTAIDNPAGAVECGTTIAWAQGNVLVDSSRADRTRGFGAAIAGNTVVFGAFLDNQALSICGAFDVLDGVWHHIALGRRASNGQLFLFIDGGIQAVAKGPAGDLSYPDDATPGSQTDPKLVFGVEKHGGLGFTGQLDEIRISTKLRYESTFEVPTARLDADGQTVILWHLDEASGAEAPDSAVIDGGPTPGDLVQLGEPIGPTWVEGGAL